MQVCSDVYLLANDGCAVAGSACSWWSVLVAVHVLSRAAGGLGALPGLVALLPAGLLMGQCLSSPLHVRAASTRKRRQASPDL